MSRKLSISKHQLLGLGRHNFLQRYVYIYQDGFVLTKAKIPLIVPNEGEREAGDWQSSWVMSDHLSG